MVIFGLLLLLVGIGAAALAVWVSMAGQTVLNGDGSSALAMPLFGGNAFQVRPMTLVVLGIIGLVLAVLGLWLMINGTKRAARRARENRDLRKQQKRQEKELAETRSRLAANEGRPAPAPHTEPVAGARGPVAEERVQSYEPGRDARVDGRDDIPPVDPQRRA